MMIRDICPSLKPGTAVAHGPRFDIHRVMDVGFAVFRAFAEALPDGEPELLMRFGPLAGWKAFDEDLLMLQKMVLMDDAGHFDVCQTHFSMRVGNLDIGFNPFGGEALVRQGIVWLNGDREPLEAFDHTPHMIIMRTFYRDLSAEDDVRVVGRLLGLKLDGDDGRPLSAHLKRHELCHIDAVLAPFVGKEGIEVDLGPIAFVRFPYEAFGDGEGTLRIEICDENE